MSVAVGESRVRIHELVDECKNHSALDVHYLALPRSSRAVDDVAHHIQPRAFPSVP